MYGTYHLKSFLREKKLFSPQNLTILLDSTVLLTLVAFQLTLATSKSPSVHLPIAAEVALDLVGWWLAQLFYHASAGGLLLLQLHCSRHHWILDRATHSTSRHYKILTGIVRQIMNDQRARRIN
jgi:hypothetical protein